MRLGLWKLISKYIKTIRIPRAFLSMCLGIWLRYKIRNTKIKIRTGLLHMHGKPGAGRTRLLCSLSALEYRSRKPSVVTNKKEFLLSTRILNWILGKWFIGVRARAILLTKTYRMQNVALSSRKPKGKRERKDKKRMWTYQQAIGYLKLQTPDGATCQSKATAFCGQPGDCTRLCAGCVSKWERQTKLEEPHNFAFYLLHKPGIIISISRCNMLNMVPCACVPSCYGSTCKLFCFSSFLLCACFWSLVL